MPSIDKINLPKPGLRNIKTALSVFFCILLFELIGRPNPLFACSAAIICMKETVYYSFKKGVDRLIGTLLGGLVGLVFLLIKNKLPILYSQSIIGGLGILIVIYLCNLLKKSEATVISSIVFLAIVISASETSPYIYALNRTADTFVGIIIALIVNKSIYPMKQYEMASGSDT
jgi:uncharacterized membrane protein YgaE (UPF0421/DUF939 family)